MSWISRVFSNPVKTIADVSSFGITFVGRQLPSAVGGGEKGFFAKASEVYGATAEGVAVGFATGGIPGAFTGGAAGFGRGISGVINNESGKSIAGGVAKWSAISGGVTGAVRGAATTTGAELGVARQTTLSEQFASAGAAGVIRNAVVSGATIAPKLPGLTAPKITGFATSITAASSLISALRPVLPGTNSTSIAPPSVPNITLSEPRPGALNVGNPTDTPSSSPGVIVLPAAEAKAFPWWVLALVILAAVLYINKKKKGHHG